MNKLLILLCLLLPLTGFAQTAVKSSAPTSTVVAPEVKKKSPTEVAKIEPRHEEMENQSAIEIVESKFPEKITDWLLCFVTAGLVWLGFRQEKVLKQSIDVTEKSVAVAKQQAEIIPKIERAYVFLGKIKYAEKPIDPTRPVGSQLPQNSAALQNPIKKFNFTLALFNHGKTPALIKSVFVKMEITQSVSDINWTQGVLMPPGQVIGASDSLLYDGDFISTTMNFNSMMQGGGPYMWICGSITYDDITGTERETKFCLKFDTVSQIFKLHHAAGLNSWS